MWPKILWQVTPAWTFLSQTSNQSLLWLLSMQTPQMWVWTTRGDQGSWYLAIRLTSDSRLIHFMNFWLLFFYLSFLTCFERHDYVNYYQIRSALPPTPPALSLKRWQPLSSKRPVAAAALLKSRYVSIIAATMEACLPCEINVTVISKKMLSVRNPKQRLQCWDQKACAHCLL